MIKTIDLRVTSIPVKGLKDTLIKGVPLDKHNFIKHASHVVQVFAKYDQLPVLPEIGQHWQVSGFCNLEISEDNLFRYYNHNFRNPKSLVVTLPKTDEYFIKFIANQTRMDESQRDLKACSDMVQACFDSADYIEGRRAFMEKRKPIWQGK